MTYTFALVRAGATSAQQQSTIVIEPANYDCPSNGASHGATHTP